MTRYWGGAADLTDAQAAELFAKHLPLVEMSLGLRRRLIWRMRIEIWRMRLKLLWLRVVGWWLDFALWAVRNG